MQIFFFHFITDNFIYTNHLFNHYISTSIISFPYIGYLLTGVLGITLGYSLNYFTYFFGRNQEDIQTDPETSVDLAGAATQTNVAAIADKSTQTDKITFDTGVQTALVDISDKADTASVYSIEDVESVKSYAAIQIQTDSAESYNSMTSQTETEFTGYLNLDNYNQSEDAVNFNDLSIPLADISNIMHNTSDNSISFNLTDPNLVESVAQVIKDPNFSNTMNIPVQLSSFKDMGVQVKPTTADVAIQETDSLVVSDQEFQSTMDNLLSLNDITPAIQEIGVPWSQPYVAPSNLTDVVYTGHMVGSPVNLLIDSPTRSEMLDFKSKIAERMEVAVQTDPKPSTFSVVKEMINSGELPDSAN